MEMLVGGSWQRAASGRTEDVGDGAKLLTGGERDGAIVAPAVVTGVDPRSPLSPDELFSPEGPRSAVAEMTDTKTVILHGRPW
jgi:acyl-CoA reductase-like NAD-dependent aldehyde dehydrogenase